MNGQPIQPSEPIVQPKLTKRLQLMWVVTMVSFISLALSGAAYLTRPGPPPPPRVGLCEYPSPRLLITPGPYHVGQQIIEKRVTCIEGSKEVINVLATRTFINEDDGTHVPSLDPNGEPQTRGPGLNTAEVPVQLPVAGQPFGNDSPGVYPGHWHLTGVDLLPATGELRVWTSASFEVVP